MVQHSPSTHPGSLYRYIARRIVWAFVVVYLVATAIFALVVMTPDEERAMLQFAAGLRGEQLDLEEPPSMSEQYIDWLGSFVRLDWGTSAPAARYSGDGRFDGTPVSNAEAVLETVPVTLSYVVPSTVLAFVLALSLGYYTARNPRSWWTRLSANSMYLVFSLPNFLVAALIFFTLQDLNPGWFPSGYEVGAGFTWSNLVWLTLPAFVLTTHLLAGYFRYTRAETREALTERYIKIVRAKGASRRRIARHVFRNAAVPLVTLFVTELIGILLVTVFVIEVVFEVPGVGLLAYEGVTNREIELVMILTVLFSIVVVLSNLLQDIAAVTLDARIEF